MEASGDKSSGLTYDDLTDQQRLKAALHYATMKTCQKTENKYSLSISQQAVFTIAEIVWKQMGSFAVDLEQFTNHARRSVVSPDDVFLLLRRNNCLLKYIKDIHHDQLNSREEAKKKRNKEKRQPSEAVSMQRHAQQETQKASKVGLPATVTSATASGGGLIDADVSMQRYALPKTHKASEFGLPATVTSATASGGGLIDADLSLQRYLLPKTHKDSKIGLPATVTSATASGDG